jgi:glycosyltransferase involved in cell wall biosynthesis
MVNADKRGPAPSPRRKRHCMVVHAYYPLGETRVQREAMALLEHGFDVTVVCLRNTGESSREEIDGVDIVRLPVRRHRGSGFIAQLLEYLLFSTLASIRLTMAHVRQRFDTIQVHNLPDFLVFAALIPRLMGTPVILDLHDLMPEFFAARTDASPHSFLLRAVRFQEKLSCRFASHVITVTQGWRETLIGRGVPADKVSVVMNVADTRVFRMRPDPAPADADRFELLYHGTFTHRYGVDLIVTAAHVLRDEIPELRVRLLGDGDTREDLVGMIGDLDAADRVTLSEGMVGVDDLPDAIARADVGIVPNRSNVFTDGILPTKLLEYVAMGVPVIAARTPTVESYFDDRQVEYFAPGDADDLAKHIRILHADPERRKTLVHNADEFNRSFPWHVISANYAEVVGRLAAKNG